MPPSSALSPFCAHHHMIQRQLEAAGVHQASLLEAMSSVPREPFFAPAYQPVAYAEAALPLDHGQYSLPPSLLAICLQALELKNTDRVLLIGSGSGYSAVIISMLVRSLHIVEYFESLADQTQEQLLAHQVDHASITVGNGLNPAVIAHHYDAIFLSGAVHTLPAHFEKALADQGRLLCFLPNQVSLYRASFQQKSWSSHIILETQQPFLIPGSFDTPPSSFIF